MTGSSIDPTHTSGIHPGGWLRRSIAEIARTLDAMTGPPTALRSVAARPPSAKSSVQREHLNRPHDRRYPATVSTRTHLSVGDGRRTRLRPAVAPPQQLRLRVSAEAVVAAGKKPWSHLVPTGWTATSTTGAALKTVKGLVDKRGTYYQESRAIAVAETNPNHTAMITGAYGDTSGIPANDFYLYGSGATRSTAARW